MENHCKTPKESNSWWQSSINETCPANFTVMHHAGLYLLQQQTFPRNSNLTWSSLTVKLTTLLRYNNHVTVRLSLDPRADRDTDEQLKGVFIEAQGRMASGGWQDDGGDGGDGMAELGWGWRLGVELSHKRAHVNIGTGGKHNTRRVPWTLTFLHILYIHCNSLYVNVLIIDISYKNNVVLI